MMNDRRYIIQFVIILVASIYLIKLFFIQIIDDTYKSAAESNIIRRKIEYPSRGLIFDRNQKLIVNNSPVYDLMVIPKEVRLKETLVFCDLLKISKDEFIEKMEKAKGYSYYKPSLFYSQVSNAEFAQLQDHLDKYRGFYINYIRKNI